MKQVLLVAAGGGLGAAARYLLAGAVQRHAGALFPYGTLAVNALGCLAIGMLMSIFEDRFLVQPSLRLFLTVGILGGFTTFSSFSYETIELLRAGSVLAGMANIAASLLCCLAGTWLGLATGKLI
jgi:fluoride exporter